MGNGDLKTKRGKISNGSFGVLRRRKRKKRICTYPNENECVYCGIPLLKKSAAKKIEKQTKKYPDNGVTSDHVPQKCLFDGYQTTYKNNRFTVPACNKCNFEFSQVEQELRNLIGIANENDDLQMAITESSVKSILGQKNGEKRLIKDNQGKVIGVEFDLDKLLVSHLKNFKGVFYKTYKKRLPDTFKVHVLDRKLKNNFEDLAIDFLDRNCKWNVSGHKDIFKFKIALISAEKSGTIVESENIGDSIAVLCHMVYHNKLDIFVVAYREKLVRKRIN